MKSKKKSFIPHDYGLTNIKNAVNRYKGTCLFEQDRKGLLSVVIILFVGYQTFLLSDFIQSFSYASKSVIPAIRKTAELQFYTYPFFDLSDVILAVHNDNVKVDIKRPMSPEEDLPLIRDFLDAVSSAKGIYDEDPVISMIFFEEYQRYTNGVVSLDEFVDSYYARVSIYLKEKET